jgi:hypothetical protein
VGDQELAVTQAGGDLLVGLLQQERGHDGAAGVIGVAAHVRLGAEVVTLHELVSSRAQP